MATNLLKKKRSLASYFKLQHMVLQNEVSVLKIKSQRAEYLTEKCREEYFSVVKDVSELQKVFGFSLDKKTYADSFIVISKKYDELQSNYNDSNELEKELQKKMHLLVLQKRKIDHLNDLVKEYQFSELDNELGK